jgi:hypothetical protein
MFSSSRPTFRDREAGSAFAGRQLTGRFYIVRHKRRLPMQTEVSRIRPSTEWPREALSAGDYTLGEDQLSPSPGREPIYYPTEDIKAPQIAGRSALVPMQDH